MRLASAMLAAAVLAIGAPAALAVEAVDDTTPPAVGVSFPAPDSFVTDATPVFTGVAGTAAGDRDAVTVEIFTGETTDGTAVHTIEASVTGDSWSAQVPAPLAEGPYTLRATQEDEAGNAAGVPVGFVIDTVAPALTIVTPEADVRVLELDVAGAAGTDPGDAEAVDVALFSGPSATGQAIFTANRSAFGSYRQRTPKLTEGVYTVRVSQSDAAGNESRLDRTFRVDVTAPVPLLETPAAGAELPAAQVHFSGSAGTAAGDAAQVVIVLDSATDGVRDRSLPVPVVDGRFSGVHDVQGSGAFTVSVKQRDAAGNWTAAPATRSVTFTPRQRFVAPMVGPSAVADRTAPRVTLPRTFRRVGRQLAVRPSFDEAGTVVASLRLGRTVLARTNAPVWRAGRVTLKLKASRSALAKVRRSRRRLTLVVTATDDAGNARTVRGLVKLKR